MRLSNLMSNCRSHTVPHCWPTYISSRPSTTAPLLRPRKAVGLLTSRTWACVGGLREHLSPTTERDMDPRQRLLRLLLQVTRLFSSPEHLTSAITTGTELVLAELREIGKTECALEARYPNCLLDEWIAALKKINNGRLRAHNI